MATVSLRDVTKVYSSGKDAGVCAVQGIDLAVRDGEFMVLVGPSGCGKSTTLRMIAGLEDISSGTIAIGDRVVNDVPAKDRDIAMVFQNYALYPHMSVYENMAFGLRLRRVPLAEIDRRVREAAALLGLESLLARRPQALSGGQRQRVAVGRAIVRQPKVFLFDEPLSNLDAKMRVSTRTELSRLHARLGATMVYVTHDQSEAMTMGDRICVMRDGKIVQVAPPLEVYDHPANLFVASFIGSPAMNLIPGTLAREGSQAFFCPAGSPAPDRLSLPSSIGAPDELTAGRAVVLGLRPEAIALTPGPIATLEAGVDLVEPMGAETFLHLRAGPHTLIARVAPHVRATVGQRLRLALDLTRARLFDQTTERALAPFSAP